MATWDDDDDHSAPDADVETENGNLGFSPSRTGVAP
jgi:hypothetical protein